MINVLKLKLISALTLTSLNYFEEVNMIILIVNVVRESVSEASLVNNK